MADEEKKAPDFAADDPQCPKCSGAGCGSCDGWGRVKKAKAKSG